GATSGGIAFTLFLPLFPSKAPFARDNRDWEREDVRAASYLRPLVKPAELVYRREGPAIRYVQWAGLSVPWIDWATHAFGFPETLVRARQNLLKSLPPTPQPYLEQGLVWFVLDPDDTKLLSHAQGWVSSGVAQEMKSFGKLRIFRLLGARSP